MRNREPASTRGVDTTTRGSSRPAVSVGRLLCRASGAADKPELSWPANGSARQHPLIECEIIARHPLDGEALFEPPANCPAIQLQCERHGGHRALDVLDDKPGEAVLD